jgi:hypothetical protein
MNRKFRHSYTHCYFVLRSIQVSSLAGYWNSSPTEFCVNNTTSKGRVWFLIAFGSTYFMSREMLLEKVYFRCRINKSYRKRLLKLKEDEKVKHKFILNVKISGKYLSQWHTVDRLLLGILFGDKNIVYATGDIFVIFVSIWTLMWPVLRPTSNEYGDGNSAGLPFTCHIFSALITFKFPSHFISLSAILFRPPTSSS